MALESSSFADRRPHIFLNGEVPTERAQSKVVEVSSEAGQVVESNWPFAKCITRRIYILQQIAVHLMLRANVMHSWFHHCISWIRKRRMKVRTFRCGNENHTVRMFVDQSSNKINLFQGQLHRVEMLWRAGHIRGPELQQ